MNHLPEQYQVLLTQQRLAELAAENRVTRLRTVRRLERRAATATRRASLARLAIQ